MKKFRFPLRPVAVMRAHRELRAREALAAAIHEYVHAEEQLASARDRVGELAGIISRHRDGRLRAADASAFQQAYRLECAGEAAAARKAAEASAAMEQRRADYIDASRALKAVGKLEERARQAHRRAFLRAEQAELDEIAVGRAMRGGVQA